MSDEILVPALSMFIPIISVTVSFGALIVWIVVSYRRRKYEIDCRHKERMAAIEKGLELPLGAASGDGSDGAPRSRYLLRGLIWLGVGLALTFGGRDWLRAPMGGSGWIAVAVGAAYLIFYFVEGRKTTAPKRDVPALGWRSGALGQQDHCGRTKRAMRRRADRCQSLGARACGAPRRGDRPAAARVPTQGLWVGVQRTSQP